MSVEERKPHVLLLAIRVKFSELMRCVASLVFKRGIRAERQELRLCVTVSASSSLMASATPMVCRFYPVARHTRSHQCPLARMMIVLFIVLFQNQTSYTFGDLLVTGDITALSYAGKEGHSTSGVQRREGGRGQDQMKDLSCIVVPKWCHVNT